MLEPNFFNTLFVFPILNLLISFYKLFLLLKIPGAFGLAIISLTVLIRFILNPFFQKQLETAKKMQDIKPHMDKLSLKHKKDPKKLQQEQMNLYKQFGINPASGCLFLIIQFPIFIALYNTLSLLLLNGSTAKAIAQINKVLYFSFLKIQSIDPWFYGFNLALSPANSHTWYYMILPLLTAFLQYYQVKVSTPSSVKAVEDKSAITKGKEGSENKGDFQSAMQTQMKYVFPILIGYFSYTLPVGLSLYWNIFSLFSIIQYKQMGKK